METQGSRLPDRTVKAERQVSWIRFAIIAFNICVYYLILDRTGTIEWLALAVSVVAGAYAMFIVLLRPYETFGVLGSSIWTTTTDTGLIAMWLLATGGAASPFFVLWSISLIAIGYRYGPRVTIQATGVYLVAEGAFLAFGGAIFTAPGLIRLAYIGFTGGLMAFVSAYTILGMHKQERLAEAVQELEVAKADVDDAKTRMQAILDNAPSTIFEVDLDGRITYMNRFASGLTEEQVIGQPATRFITEDDRPRFQEAIQQVMQSDRAMALELQGDGPDGGTRDYRSHLGPLKDAAANIRGAIIITMDVTEEKEQAKLAQETQHQKEQVARLEKEAEFRSRFINNAAHELNTPLTPLRLQVGVLRNVLGGSHREMRAVEVMERNLKRLGGLVTDLLDATRVQEGRGDWNLETVDLTALMKDAAETFEHVADERSIALEVGAEPGTLAYADPQRVSQVVYNLLSNALKFTPSGGRVQCEALPGKDGDHVDITVTDTGPGLTDEDKARLFLPFSQVHPSLVPEEPGTGLGLYLSRSLAEAQGGTLDVSSPGRGKGSTFRLTLPVRPAATSSEVDPEAEATPSGSDGPHKEGR